MGDPDDDRIDDEGADDAVGVDAAGVDAAGPVGGDGGDDVARDDAGCEWFGDAGSALDPDKFGDGDAGGVLGEDPDGAASAFSCEDDDSDGDDPPPGPGGRSNRRGASGPFASGRKGLSHADAAAALLHGSQATVFERYAGRLRGGLRARPRGFPVHALRPCARIHPEAFGGQDVEGRYRALTGDLPLVGDVAMRPAPGGGIHLVEALRDEAPWFEDAIALIERQLRLALFAARPWLQWRPLLLAGPPGIGKNHLASLIAREAGTAASLLSLGGTDDVRVLDGTARGWLSTQPCWPAVAMSQTRVANPILILDEVDKVGRQERGRAVHDVLLMMLERTTASAYYDKCLMAPVDLGSCLWILTANDVASLPRPLLSRVDVVWTPGPGIEHFDLALANVISSIAREWRLAEHALPSLPARALVVLRRSFARHRSMRSLRRHVDDLLAVLVGDPCDRLQ